MDTEPKLEPERDCIVVSSHVDLRRLCIDSWLTCCNLLRLQANAWKDSPVPCIRCTSQKNGKLAFAACQTGEGTRSYFLSCRARAASVGKLSTFYAASLRWEQQSESSELSKEFTLRFAAYLAVVFSCTSRHRRRRFGRLTHIGVEIVLKIELYV